MSILARLGVSPAAAAPTSSARLTADQVAAHFKERGRVTGQHAPVSWSAELGRIAALPRRALEASEQEIAALEQELRAEGVKCECEKQRRPHCDHFRPDQARTLLEARRSAAEGRGLIAGLGVGAGKTLIDVLLPAVVGAKRAVLLIPANLRAQLLERDWPYYAGHWKLPNVAGGRWFVAGRPVLHVISYSELSTQKGSTLLKQINPELIIGDEAHNLKDRKGPRWRRVMRFRDEARPDVRFALQSGTLATRSVKDTAHLADAALGDGSPLPRLHHTVDEWAAALDPLATVADPGALKSLAAEGEDPREGVRRRIADTRGVVLAPAGTLGASLVIRKRSVTVPPEVAKAIAEVHRLCERPDGEQFREKLEEIACARQLASGFFHRWKYPHGEPEALIRDWFEKRQAWNREIREQLKHPRENLDTPGLLENAAVRAHAGAPKEDGPQWWAESWIDWRDVREQVKPEPEAVWISDFLIADAAAWADDCVRQDGRGGIVWVEYPELGYRIAKAAKIPYFGGGPAASDEIGRERGDRSIVASIKAHGTGKNLQMFARNLVATPPADGATWEQLVGRTHRPGQLADEVTVDVYQHTADVCDALAKAREYALFQQQITGNAQKLLYAAFEW